MQTELNAPLHITLNALPIILMVALIPAIKNDYLLTGVYALIIAVAFSIKREPRELQIFGLGFCMMIFFEYIFVSTGVETFTRRTLLGVMPLWLPVLWAYGFVALKRGALILHQ